MDNESGQDQGSANAGNGSEAQREGRPQRVSSGYVERRIQETLAGLRTEEIRRNYAQAMIMAANLGNLQQICPCHPSQIYRECRLNPSMQREYGIILSKDDAIEFLRDFCSTTISDTSFKRAHTRDTYNAIFGRDPMKVGRRQILCTYAEWLYMHDYLFEPRLPEELIALVPNGWRPPEGDKSYKDTSRNKDS